METITIDNEDVVIAKLSPELQNQIALFEHITLETVRARKELATFELARSACSSQVAQMYAKHKADKAEKAVSEEAAVES